MSSIAIPMLAADRLQRIARLGQLFRLLRGITGPLTTPENLRQAIESLLEVAGLVGLDQEWIDRLDRILADDHVFQIVLAVVRAVAGWTGSVSADKQLRVSSAAQHVVVDTQGFVDWLPIVIQIIQLLRQLRGDS